MAVAKLVQAVRVCVGCGELARTDASVFWHGLVRRQLAKPRASKTVCGHNYRARQNQPGVLTNEFLAVCEVFAFTMSATLLEVAFVQCSIRLV